MPNPAAPRIDEWVPYLVAKVGSPDKDTYLVGYSMGCQTILRYLERLRGDERIGGALFVAGFFKIREGSLEEHDKSVAGPWEAAIDLKNAKEHCGKFVTILSDDDPFVELNNGDIFKRELGSKLIVIPKAGHFTIALGGYKELHVALNELLKIVT